MRGDAGFGVIRNPSLPLGATFVVVSMVAAIAVANVPSNDHSEAIVAEVGPRLDADLATIGHELGDPIFVRAFKESSELEVWVAGDDGTYDLFRTYPICAWSGQLGPKLAEGDLQVPEGFYYADAGRMRPDSQWHLAINTGYPNRYDRSLGRTGSAIMIHGVCGSSGCLAMTNPLIEEIYTLADAALREGQGFFRIHIFPFRMSDENMARHADSEWLPFWENLREGYDWFESGRVPPNVEVEDGRYVFE